MLVANSLDLWQKDTFFSAAEEVQRSADMMESSYRRWLRARREGWKSEHLDEITRELQMALGTAKWQLEEFERAVRMSYRSHGDDITISRHSQFVSALEEQISSVEAALKESLEVDGKKPFRWVNLDEEEYDDLALFLSGTSQRIPDEAAATSLQDKEIDTEEGSNLGSEISTKIPIPNQEKTLQEVTTNSDHANCFVEHKESRLAETGDEISFQADRVASNCITFSLSECSLEIVIDKDDRQKNTSIESTLREKSPRPFFWSCEGELSSRTLLKMSSWINQHLRGYHRNQRQQMSPLSPVKSMRLLLALMLTIFLVVPFLVHSP